MTVLPAGGNLVIDHFAAMRQYGQVQRRYLQGAIRELAWAPEKMVFVSGPRQCGKTTLGKLLLRGRRGRYFNWDDVEFRRRWVKRPRATASFPEGRTRPLVVYDEIHKARGWKRTLKGIFDTLEHPCDIMVTGSARLAVYRRGGDSLLGRYFRFRLHPFSLGELERKRTVPPDTLLDRIRRGSIRAGRGSATALSGTFDALLRYGGFPEPFLRQDERFLRLWRTGRVEKIVREDLRDLSRIPELSRVEMLVSLLPERAGGPLSVQSLREDLEVGHHTVSRWLNYLAELYYLFEVKPWARAIPRALRKEGKLYLWDWTDVDEPGHRFDNLVACHLLKACHYWTDTGEGQFDLRYVRDKQKREIDFLIVRDCKPWLAIECKLSEQTLAPGLALLLPKLDGIPFLQLVRSKVKRRRVTVGNSVGQIAAAPEFLALLP